MLKNILTAAWLIALMAYILAGTALVPFHGDESTQIFMSRDYAYQFLQRDLLLVRYADPPISAQEQELRLLNGTVNKYLIGFAWHVAGFTVADLNQQWDWGADWDYNQRTGHAPSESSLQIARLPSALLLALGVIPMFAIGWLAGGRTSALISSTLYTFSPALLLNGRRAMMEGSTIAFTLLTVWAGGWLIGVWERRRDGWLPAVVLGLAAGLSLASKHTALFTVAAVFAGCGLFALIASFRTRSVQWRQFGGLLIGVVAIVAVFIALNPAWWGDPLARMGDVLRLRTSLLDVQTDVFGAYSDAIAAMSGFFDRAFYTQPQYFEVGGWLEPLSGSIATYEQSGLSGITIHFVRLPLFGLSVVGGVGLVRRSTVSRLILLWALTVIVSTLIVTPLNWQRYYLAAHLAVIVLMTAGVQVFVQATTARQSRSQADAAPSSS